MSQGISSFVSLARVLAGSQTVSARLADLSRQATTGKRSETFGGLGAGTKQSVSLRAEIARRDAYVAAIRTGTARAEAMQGALGRIGALADDMAKAALRLNGTSQGEVEGIAKEARAALQEVATILNSQVQGEYLFSGTDTSRPAVPDAAGVLSGPFAAEMASAVGELGTAPLATVVAKTVAVAADTTAPTTVFSAFLETPASAGPAGGKGAEPRAVPVADGLRIELDLRANENAAAVSGPGGTGSFVRDILRGLAVLASVGTATAEKADFPGLLRDVADGLRSAGRTLGDERAAIGVAERRLERAADDHADTRLLLEKQLSDVEDVDMAETLSRLQLTRTQLEGSYQIVAAMRDLSLAKLL